MRHIAFTTTAALLGLMFGAATPAATPIPETANIDLPYPGQVDLVGEPSRWTYRQSQTELPLYMSLADPSGKSNCDDGCAKQWIALIAAADARPLGEWTIILRPDGQHQWAFKNHAVYTNIHDTPKHATGAGGSWRLMPYFQQP